MNERSEPSPVEPRSNRLRFELIFGSIWLAFGLFILPALVFWVGITMLGPYGEGAGAGMGTFYGEYYGDLASGVGRAWTLALGPLLLISLLRAVFIGSRRQNATPEVHMPPPDTTPKNSDRRRAEPRLGD